MADIYKTSSDVVIPESEAQQSEGPPPSQRPYAVNTLRRHLSRTITQPRGLYESIIDTYGPVTAPNALQVEEPELSEVYNSLQTSCSSDTETCSSHEDSQESHDLKDGRGTRRGRHNVGQGSKPRRRNPPENRSEAQQRTDQEWAKSILSRRTGYGCLQRNQVGKYISQLEMAVDELQAEISNLSPQVMLLEKRRWILQVENDTLKQKITELSLYRFFKADQTSALQKEFHVLKIQRADQLQEAVLSLEERSHAGHGHGHDGEAGTDLAIGEDHAHDQSSSSNFQTTKEELEETPHVPIDSSREANTGIGRSSPNSQKEPKADGPVPRQVTLVKWPSTLYRSVSAIRKDVLEMAIEEST